MSAGRRWNCEQASSRTRATGSTMARAMSVSKLKGEYQEAVPEPHREHKGPFVLSRSRHAGTAVPEPRRGEMVLGTK